MFKFKATGHKMISGTEKDAFSLFISFMEMLLQTGEVCIIPSAVTRFPGQWSYS